MSGPDRYQSRLQPPETANEGGWVGEPGGSEALFYRTFCRCRNSGRKGGASILLETC